VALHPGAVCPLWAERGRQVEGKPCLRSTDAERALGGQACLRFASLARLGTRPVESYRYRARGRCLCAMNRPSEPTRPSDRARRSAREANQVVVVLRGFEGWNLWQSGCYGVGNLESFHAILRRDMHGVCCSPSRAAFLDLDCEVVSEWVHQVRAGTPHQWKSGRKPQWGGS